MTEDLSKYFWHAPRLWTNSPVFIIGGGPSLKSFNFDLIKQYRVIGCNDAYQLGSWVDICIFGDRDWYKIHAVDELNTPDRGKIPGLNKYPGLIVSACPDFQDKEKYPRVRCMMRRARGFATKKYELAWNYNTGSAAINLAYHLGASKVILLGFDMKLGEKGENDCNWHYNLKDPEQKEHIYTKFLNMYPTMEKEMRYKIKGDFKVLNATPNTELDTFPKVNLEDILDEL